MTPAHAAVRALVVTHGLDDVRRALRLVTEEWDDGSDEPVERTEPRHKDWHRWVRGREVGRRVEWRCRVCGLQADAPQSAKTPGAVKGRARMLQPHELFAAQGFPETYDLLAGTLTKTQQIELAGNSVAPPVAAAVVRAQLGGAEAVAA